MLSHANSLPNCHFRREGDNMKKSSKILAIVCAGVAAVSVASISYAVWVGFPREQTVDGKTGMLETYGFSEIEHNLSNANAVWVPYDQEHPINNMVKVWEIKVKRDGVQTEDPSAYRVTISYADSCAEEMKNCMYFFSGTEPFSEPVSLDNNWTLIKDETYQQEVKLDADNKIYVVFDSWTTQQMNKKAKLKITLITNRYEITNGNFEMGDLSGWMVKPFGADDYTMIGRGETTTEFAGIKSETDTKWNNNFDNGIYNQEGHFHLDGWAGTFSDPNSEFGRGTLKSSLFTLGGTGKISFRLGGGKRINDTYISVKTKSGVEIARFTNIKQHTKDDQGRGEQYMWTYVYDLTQVASLGDELYLEIVDNAQTDWGLLFVDDIKTYHTEQTFAALGTKDVDYYEAENQI